MRLTFLLSVTEYKARSRVQIYGKLYLGSASSMSLYFLESYLTESSPTMPVKFCATEIGCASEATSTHLIFHVLSRHSALPQYCVYFPDYFT